MSLTFSDRGVSPGQTSFRTLVIALISLLSVVIVGVGAWSMLQGPQLRDVQSDDQSLHQRAGAFVALRSDRAIEPVDIDQVRITPDAPFDLEDDGLSIRLTFEQPLLANTNYVVEVTGVRPTGFGQESAWSTSFTTGGFDFVFLREVGDIREVHRAVPGAPGTEVVYRAPGIVSVTPVASVLAVLREVGEETWLELVDPTTGVAERIVMPPGFQVVDLANASWGTTLVTIANVTEQPGGSVFGALVLIDVLSDRTPVVVEGIAGDPLSVRTVAVSPQSGEILVWQKNQELVRFNPLNSVVLPVGTASELWGFDALGAQALYVDGLGTLSQNLSTGELTRVPRGEFEGISLRHQKFALAPSGLRVHRAQLPGLGDGDPYSIVTREDAEGVHTLVTGSLDAPSSIGNIALSPNGQFLLVEVNPDSSPLGYQGLTAEQIAVGTVIRVVDLRENTVVGEFPGFGFVW
ncbi:MAG: hypothetical protein HOJ98_06275 [Microbacteriaceae bacterium]|nr:hypothetical protein [Microbacteriaceae bacterium]